MADIRVDVDPAALRELARDPHGQPHRQAQGARKAEGGLSVAV
jgi:hypothetical protein